MGLLSSLLELVGFQRIEFSESRLYKIRQSIMSFMYEYSDMALHLEYGFNCKIHTNRFLISENYVSIDLYCIKCEIKDRIKIPIKPHGRLRLINRMHRRLSNYSDILYFSHQIYNKDIYKQCIHLSSLVRDRKRLNGKRPPQSYIDVMSYYKFKD